MSHIEAEAKRFSRPLILGEENALIGIDAQWAIARWAYLKILLFERVDTRYRLLPKRRYQEMYDDSQHEPTLPAGMTVLMAAHKGLRHGQYQRRLLADPRTRKPELFVGTITVKHLVVQVIEDIAENRERKSFQHDLRVGGFEARIWPFSDPFRWPPPRALTDLGLEIFGGPQPGEISGIHRRLFQRLFLRTRYLESTSRSRS